MVMTNQLGGTKMKKNTLNLAHRDAVIGLLCFNRLQIYLVCNGTKTLGPTTSKLVIQMLPSPGN